MIQDRMGDFILNYSKYDLSIMITLLKILDPEYYKTLHTHFFEAWIWKKRSYVFIFLQ